MLELDVPVVGGSCYLLGFGPRSQKVLRASVGFKDQRGATFEVKDGAEAPRICATSTGDAHLTISPAQGGVGRFELALALAESKESPTERAERTRAERSASDTQREVEESNLTLQEDKSYGSGAAAACHECRTVLRDCVKASGRQCVEQFEVCSRSVGHDASARGWCRRPR